MTDLPKPLCVEIGVLDHGYVRLVDSMGEDFTIIEAARMSTGKGFLGWGPRHEDNCGTLKLGDLAVSSMNCSCPGKPGDEKLLEFLYSHKHMTPFEMCELHVEMQAPIMVFREIHRHRTFSFNEFSARYAQMPDLHYLPEVKRIRKQDKKNKQGSGEPLEESLASSHRLAIESDQRNTYRHYEVMLSDGVAKEVARMNTPVSRYSKHRMKGNLRNWLQFLTLRMAPDVMMETRVYAEAVASIIKDLWPRTYALFEEHTLHAVTLSRSQVEELKAIFGPWPNPGFPEWFKKKLGLA